jgi:hypothetical protein
MNEERSSVISNRRNKIENFIYARSLRDLLVYQEAFIVSQKIFQLIEGLPRPRKIRADQSHPKGVTISRCRPIW